MDHHCLQRHIRLVPAPLGTSIGSLLGQASLRLRIRRCGRDQPHHIVHDGSVCVLRLPSSLGNRRSSDHSLCLQTHSRRV